jgi:hypothetical protein
MEWRHSGLPHHEKIPTAKISWKYFRLHLLGSKQHPPHLLYSKEPNYQCEALPISAGAIEGYLKKKRRGNFTKESSSCTTMPGSPDTRILQETGLPGFVTS